MIEFDDVSFAYRAPAEGAGAPEGVRGIDLRVEAGRCVLVCGASGCGKTTVTRLANGLAPSFFPGTLEGRVLVDGRDVADLESWEVAACVGSVFQNPRTQFFNVDSTGEVAFSLESMAWHAHARERAHELVHVRRGHDDGRQKPAREHLAHQHEERRQHRFQHAGVQLRRGQHARHHHRVQPQHAQREPPLPQRDAQRHAQQHQERLEPQPGRQEHRDGPQQKQRKLGPRIGPERAIDHAVTPAFSNCFFSRRRPTSALTRAHTSVSAIMPGSTQPAPVDTIVSRYACSVPFPAR